jgi:hypothetical protein
MSCYMEGSFGELRLRKTSLSMSLYVDGEVCERSKFVICFAVTGLHVWCTACKGQRVSPREGSTSELRGKEFSVMVCSILHRIQCATLWAECISITGELSGQRG